MASTIKVDKIEGSTGSTITIPTGQTFTVTDGIAASTLTGALPAISGASLTTLTAGNISSGTVPTARLGSGTASASTFLRGDQTYAAAGGGKIGQVQYTQITDTEETTATSFTTIPTLQVTITPSASDSVIAIDCYLSYNAGTSVHSMVQLFRDTTQIAMGDASGSTSRTTFGWRSSSTNMTYSAWPVQFRWIDNPADTSAHTYSMKWYVNTANAWLGRPVDSTDAFNYNRSPCSISASEILA